MVLCDLVLWFFIYSAYGWVYETIFCSFQAGEFADRGFFYGPYLPIYGFGALFVIFLLHRRMTKLQQFILSLTVTTALEYATSYLLEVIFHKTWWNYTNYYFQLNGRICLVAALLFGVLGVLLINYIHPFVKKKTDKITKHMKIILSTSFVSILFVDFLFSLTKALS